LKLKSLFSVGALHHETNHCVYGAQVLLADGSAVTADEAYIRESILQPNAKIVAGYQPLMPTFQGQLTEEQILALTAYIKSLQSQPAPVTGKK
jgi:cytochrome c oxidase subunit 2